MADAPTRRHFFEIFQAANNPIDPYPLADALVAKKDEARQRSARTFKNVAENIVLRFARNKGR